MTARASTRRRPEPVVTLEIDRHQPVAADDLVDAWLDMLLSAVERRRERVEREALQGTIGNMEGDDA